MQLSFLLLLLAVSLALAFTAAAAKDSNLLVGSATFMLVAAAFTLSGSIEVQNGFEQTENPGPDNSTEVTRTPAYTTLSESTGEDQANQYVGLGLLGTSLYLVFQGVVPSTRDEGLVARLTQ